MNMNMHLWPKVCPKKDDHIIKPVGDWFGQGPTVHFYTLFFLGFGCQKFQCCVLFVNGPNLQLEGPYCPKIDSVLKAMGQTALTIWRIINHEG